MQSIECLPIEILTSVIQRLSLQDAYTCALTCRFFAQLFDMPAIWRHRVTELDQSIVLILKQRKSQQAFDQTSVPAEVDRRHKCILKQYNVVSNLPGSLRTSLTVTELLRTTTLDLRSKKLVCLPKSIGQLGALTSLSLYNNKLTCLPASIGQLCALTRLNLGCNYLTCLLRRGRSRNHSDNWAHLPSSASLVIG